MLDLRESSEATIQPLYFLDQEPEVPITSSVMPHAFIIACLIVGISS